MSIVWQIHQVFQLPRPYLLLFYGKCNIIPDGRLRLVCLF